MDPNQQVAMTQELGSIKQRLNKLEDKQAPNEMRGPGNTVITASTLRGCVEKMAKEKSLRDTKEEKDELAYEFDGESYPLRKSYLEGITHDLLIDIVIKMGDDLMDYKESEIKIQEILDK